MSDDDAAPEFQKNSIVLLVSREMMLDHGLVVPTPEEAAKRDTEMVEYRKKVAAGWLLFDQARTLIAEIDPQDDSTGIAVLALHAPVEADNLYCWLHCRGCDMNGSEAEPPEWPCSTARLVCERHDIALPDTMLWKRP